MDIFPEILYYLFIFILQTKNQPQTQSRLIIIYCTVQRSIIYFYSTRLSLARARTGRQVQVYSLGTYLPSYLEDTSYTTINYYSVQGEEYSVGLYRAVIISDRQIELTELELKQLLTGALFLNTGEQLIARTPYSRILSEAGISSVPVRLKCSLFFYLY